MKIFVAAFGAETNSFVPFITRLKDFAESHLVRPDQALEGDIANNGHAEFIKCVEAGGHDLMRGTFAYAQPSGPVASDVYQSLRDEILEQLRAAAPVDIVLFNLHGAMIAENEADCEGDLIRRAREIVGDQVVIGALLDLHAHLSQSMIEHATILIPFKEYPHIDFAERARALFHLCERAALGEIRPVMRMKACGAIGAFPTFDPPMQGLVREMRRLSGKDSILDASLIHSFPWGDSPDAGVKTLAVTDGDPALAETLAEVIRRKFLAIRNEASAHPLPLADGVKFIAGWRGDGPLVVADTSDNPGGGAPGDATFLISALLGAGVRDILAGVFWDPETVEQAISAGVGGSLDVELGGKASERFSGQPLRIRARVTAINPAAAQGFGNADDRAVVPLGRTVALKTDFADFVVNDVRTQTLSPDAFAAVGCDWRRYKVVLVKSSHHFRAAFEKIAGKIIAVGAPGALTTDASRLPYRRAPGNYWPPPRP